MIDTLKERIEMNKNIVRVVSILVIVLASAGFPAEQPNILLILVDEVGYADVGAFSARINNTSTDKLYYETPRIDQLAKQGTARCLTNLTN
jgi:hypothetical protein